LVLSLLLQAWFGGAWLGFDWWRLNGTRLELAAGGKGQQQGSRVAVVWLLFAARTSYAAWFADPSFLDASRFLVFLRIYLSVGSLPGGCGPDMLSEVAAQRPLQRKAVPCSACKSELRLLLLGT
jgi:hypothetical protein